MVTPVTTSSGIFDLHDFLPNYLYALRGLLHDPEATYFEDPDLIPYINEARKRVCADTGCLRTLILASFPTGATQVNFGGVYALNNPIPIPAGAVPPLQLVSGGGAKATATITAIPMTVVVNTPGEYAQAPIVTFDAPGINISATATAKLNAPAATTVQLWSNADVIGTFGGLFTTLNTGYGSQVGLSAGITGYGEINSGHAGSLPWAAAANAPNPSGNGFIWESPPALAGTILSPGTVTPSASFSLGALDTGTVTGVAYLRWWKLNQSTNTYTPILVFQTPTITITGSQLTYATWSLLSQESVIFTAADTFYVDVIFDVLTNGGGSVSSIGFGTGPTLTFGVSYSPCGDILSAIEVLSDAGLYNAANVIPTVNIVPVGIGAQVQNDGTGHLQLVTQGSGQNGNVFILDANGVLTCTNASDVSILSKYIASVDNVTLIWNSRRIALRNMAFSDFSAALRAWTVFQNIPQAFSVYGESLWIGPPPNQAYTYELDCILFPPNLGDYLTIGPISNKAAISSVKYYAAYLAKMGQQEVQAAGVFIDLYKESVSWASNLYTTRLSRNYQDNENLY